MREQGGGRKEEKGERGRKEKKKRERKRKRREGKKEREREAVGGIRGDVDHARRSGDTQRNTWDEEKKEKGL